MDILKDKNWLESAAVRIETERAGIFVFQPSLNVEDLVLPLQRVIDAQNRFRSSPLSTVANELEREVVASSVFGTNTIEGGELNEEQTQQVLDLEPDQIQEEQQRRVLNIKAAYDLALECAEVPDWRPSVDYIIEVHRKITDRLPDTDNQPGLLRDTPKSRVTRVGDKEHGGIYKPPQNGRDVGRLLKALVEWDNELANQGVPALIRAPLFHLYFEWIHPFWDGNGRVGRVLEASILLSDGFRYAPFAQARFYLTNIHKYFTLFNHCRKQRDNTPFVQLFLEGMLESIDRLHTRVNSLVSLALFRNHLRDQLEARRINKRQYAIAVHALESGKPVSLKELRRSAWYKAMYAKLTHKTMQRDLRGLREQGLIHQTVRDEIWPGCVEPDRGVAK
ncbi:MAG: Fic family protein [Rhodanobacteraceae bacterium]